MIAFSIMRVAQACAPLFPLDEVSGAPAFIMLGDTCLIISEDIFDYSVKLDKFLNTGPCLAPVPTKNSYVKVLVNNHIGYVYTNTMEVIDETTCFAHKETT